MKVGGLDRNEEGGMRESRLPEIAPRPVNQVKASKLMTSRYSNTIT